MNDRMSVAFTADEAVASAVANAALEGRELDVTWQTELRKVASGELTADELVEREVVRAVAPRNLPIVVILKRWRPGSGDWDWPDEWADLAQRDAGMTLAGLIMDIAENGINAPVLLGDDGRVWGGHHRLMVARLLGIEEVPVEYGHGGQEPAR